MIKSILTLIFFCQAISSYAGEFQFAKSYRVYDQEGHLILQKKDKSSKSDYSYYIKTENDLYKKIHMNDAEIIDKDITDLEVIRVFSLKDVRSATSDVPENTVLDSVSLMIEITQSWSSLDFHRSYQGYTLVNNILYNDFDMGNFLWGYSAAKLGVPLNTALMAAHLNGRFIDSHKIWDSEADQRAIANGYK